MLHICVKHIHITHIYVTYGSRISECVRRGYGGKLNLLRRTYEISWLHTEPRMSKGRHVGCA